ncbi:MAG: hypothetical protein AOA65_1816 [Candidatus Bathyarchaeota archaeon BA1]|nr:MAG: hypothetical protein AOA65_1816 [Candidatus Bathyarchaeota archaeon BA1]
MAKENIPQKEITWEWLAGFFDGEGYPKAWIDERNRLNANIIIDQKEKEVINKIHLFLKAYFHWNAGIGIYPVKEINSESK